MNGQEKWRFDNCKLKWHHDRIKKYYDEGKRIAPIHIDLGATKACNAKCVYCYGAYQKMSGDIMPGDVLDNLFVDAPRLGVKSLVVTGDGEPTLNPGMFHALQLGKLNGLDIGFATNGIALDSHKIEVLLNTCTWLRFNLSAVERESYKSIHGIDEWERVQAHIITAREMKKKMGSKCTIGLQMVLIPDALDQVLLEAYFARRHELDYFVIKQFSDPGCEEMSRFGLSWYHDRNVMQTLQRAEGLSSTGTKIVPKWDTIKAMGERKYDHCIDCPLLFQISGSSKCYPCGFLFGDERYCYGDLKKQSLEEIITSERYWDVVKHMATKFNVHKDCTGSCRHDATNAYMDDYLNPPDHLNFI